MTKTIEFTNVNPITNKDIFLIRNKIIKIINNNLKNSEKWSNECLSLPIHSKMRLHEVNRVVVEVKRFFLKK